MPAAGLVVAEAAASVLTFVTSSVSPWMIAGLLINYAANIESYKKAGSLLFQVFRGDGESAGCALCTVLVDRMLDLTGASDSVELADRIDCAALCPFRLKRCMKLCARLIEAGRESATFPCVAINMCPKIDEFGEIPSCEWDWKHASCTPAYVCERTRTFPWPKCEMNEGYAKWRQASALMKQKAGALFSAIHSLKKCTDPEADPHFCVHEAEGFSLCCEYLGWAIVFLVAPLQSVRAIETPGGGDDRQWLAFWIIFFLFSMIERFTIVILSKMHFYYFVKLLVIAWLCFCEGAGRLYLHIHRTFQTIHRLLRRNETLRWLSSVLGIERFFTTSEEWTEEECIGELEAMVNMSCLAPLVEDARREGLQNLLVRLTSEEAIREAYTDQVLQALTTKWHESEFRFLEIDLISASNLPVMDFDWHGKPLACDPFVVFYLVPPSRAKAAGRPTLSETNRRQRRSSLSGPESPVALSPLSALSSSSSSKRESSFRLQSLASAVNRVGDIVNGSFSRSRASLVLAAVRAPAPRGAPSQYGRTVSRTIKQNLNPVWNQMLEMEMAGGSIDADGNFVNPDTPFTSLRVEVWDRDQLSNNDFIGEFTVPLSPLMTGTKYDVERELEDPEGKSAAQSLHGSLKLSLRYTE